MRILQCLFIVLLAGCSEDGGPTHDGSSAFDLPDFAGITECVNAMATDDNCPQHCFKERGTGVGYCADTCVKDPDCAGKTHAWIPAGVSLVCHPQGGYCTRRCMDDTDCIIGAYTDKLACDPVLNVCTSCGAGC
jgi:hypothetical protein